MIRRGFQTLIALGMIGFFGAQLLPCGGDSLAHVEFPAFLQTHTIVLPEGGILTATIPTHRVQRYSSDGRFLNGWFVDAHGGNFGVGLTTDGKAVICTARGRQIFVFELDGRPVGEPQRCLVQPRGQPASEVPQILQPHDLYEAQVALQHAIEANPPPNSTAALLLVPLWHPFVAWAFVLIGILGLRSANSIKPKQVVFT